MSRCSRISRATTSTSTGRCSSTRRPRPFCSAGPGLRHAVINLDDEAGCRFAALARDHGAEVIGYSAHGDATARPMSPRLMARTIRPTADGLSFEVCADGRAWPVDVALVGHFNVANLLGVIGASLCLRHTVRCGGRGAAAARATAGSHATGGRAGRTAGRRRLCAHAGRVGAGARRLASDGRCAARTAMGGVRRRRRSRSRQARTDGGCGCGRCRCRRRDQRQPAYRGSGAIVAQVAAGAQERDASSKPMSIARGRSRMRWACRGERRRAGCRQGPRGLPDRRPRQACRSPIWRRRAPRCAWRGQSVPA